MTEGEVTGVGEAVGEAAGAGAGERGAAACTPALGPDPPAPPPPPPPPPAASLIVPRRRRRGFFPTLAGMFADVAALYRSSERRAFTVSLWLAFFNQVG